VPTVSSSLDQLCINVVRGLSIDAIQKANSGHPGLPLGTAPLSYALWTRHLRHNPANPTWLNRDRFILSAGHGSMLIYSLLHLTGYGLSLDEIKNFRQWGSLTPGHPENTHTKGVEMATGPLGQGISTSVGFAIAESYLAATFNRPGYDLFNHYTYVLAGDGDLMEGIAQEACSLAGHLGLGRLIVLYDDNKITIDGSTDLAFTENTALKFEAMGWHVTECDGMDVDAVDATISEAQAVTDKPSIIICKTVIGFGSPNRAGTSKAHGSPLGADELKLTKEALGLPEETFWVPSEALAEYRKALTTGAEQESAWNALVSAYKAAHPEMVADLNKVLSGTLDVDWSLLPTFAEPVATRNANQKIINAVAPLIPGLLSGSADLTDNVFTGQKAYSGYQKDTPGGRNIYYGVREHAMAAAANGITLHGGCRAVCGTFFVFSDYCKPSLRLAALMDCPTIFSFSHDSIGLGEDGPTHQPIEQLAGLRCIPNFNVMRPADGNEASACWKIAFESTKTPCAIITSRQALPVTTSDQVTNHPCTKGGYVLVDAENPALVLVATGSEVGLAVDAAKQLNAEGIATRVVNLPSWFLFDQQTEEYQLEVLPPELPTLSIEAGSTFGWAKYATAHIGLDHFGASAPANVLFEKFGFTVENVVARAKELLD